MRKHFLASAILGAVVMSVVLFSQPAAALAQGATAAPVYRFYYHADWEGRRTDTCSRIIFIRPALLADYKSEGIECRVWTEPLKLPQRLLYAEPSREEQEVSVMETR